jgi:cell division protein FtsX
MIIDAFMLFFFVLTMMVIIGAVPVMIVSIGNKSRNDNTKLGSSEKILQLEQKIEELEKQVNSDVRRRIENIETIITEDEYSKGEGKKMLEEKANKKIDTNQDDNKQIEENHNT